ncbi:hypothetical protein [Salinimicrobium sediminilitoris]|uniref:hypothetical protein n=1 Tax=Salinimicrobium sediminilitoris TaxID=2876715 RepID=UPI001E3A10C5|nr:hypothetical protein [Salinimicrobium sediminilitoris]MCC8361065.1 hypothetical protein [Salinimicrobium sediminilitoris]
MKRYTLLLCALFPLNLFAQEGMGAAVLLEETNFFIAVVAGVLLALGFQLLLTSISVAGGITAVGNIRKKGHSDSTKDRQKANEDHDDDDDGMNVGQKVSTGLGAWTMITTSIALFFASLLAVKLGFIGANFIGATLGLVIWAAFFMVVTYLEINMVTSLVGGLASTVKNSLSSAGSVFQKSDAGVAKDVAKTKAKFEAKDMRKQFEKLFSTHDVDKKVDDYVKQLKPQRVDIQNLKKQIKDLITDLQVTEKADFDYPNSVKKLILEEADKSTLSKEDKEAVKNHVNSIKNIAQSDASPEDKAKAGIEDLTPADREQINKYQDQIKGALQNTNKKELQPDQLEQDLKKILNEPKQATNIAKAKASAIDRETLVKLLASQDMDEREADKRISQAEKVLNKVQAYFSDGQDNAQAKKGELQQKKGDLQAKVKAMFSGGTNDLNRIYSDFTAIFQDSGAGPDLKYKLEHYNKEEMIIMITDRTSLSRSEAEPIADKIVSARDSVLEKAYEVQIKVNEKIAEAREKALIAAEESRKAAATAAWWLVATGIVSAVASAVGGMLALEGIL